MKINNSFYLSSRWKRKRELVLRRDQYECQECRRFGRVRAATMVHHVKPFEHYPELKLDMNNLISLCNSCHGTMHDRLTDELTDTGLQWVERMKRRAEGVGNL